MKRYLSGLNRASAEDSGAVPNGALLVRIERAQYRWHGQKPFYALVFVVVEPKSVAGNRFSARLDCAAKALWKLNWFLRDFGYDQDLLERDQIDDKKLTGLSGIVSVSRSVAHGTSLFNLDAFAPTEQWKRFSPDSVGHDRKRRKAAS
jgi:hypothetical protein